MRYLEIHAAFIIANVEKQAFSVAIVNRSTGQLVLLVDDGQHRRAFKIIPEQTPFQDGLVDLEDLDCLVERDLKNLWLDTFVQFTGYPENLHVCSARSNREDEGNII